MLWTGILAGPALLFANQQINYLLVYWACAHGKVFVLHLVTLLCLTAVVLTGVRSWSGWRTVRGKRGQMDETTWRRVSFMSFGGVLACGFFVIAIVAMGVPSLFIDPCHR